MDAKPATKNHHDRIGAAWIRDHLGLKARVVAGVVGRSVSVFNRIENGLVGLDLELGLKLASLYCCTPEEVKFRPQPERLAQIKADFDEARARESRAAANQVAGKAVGQ